jgi:ABC-type dipeptide/oligopeptide/nickel transport system permease subunit
LSHAIWPGPVGERAAVVVANEIGGRIWPTVTLMLVVIVILVLAIHPFGGGLRDALAPRARR